MRWSWIIKAASKLPTLVTSNLKENYWNIASTKQKNFPHNTMFRSNTKTAQAYDDSLRQVESHEKECIDLAITWTCSSCKVQRTITNILTILTILEILVVHCVLSISLAVRWIERRLRYLITLPRKEHRMQLGPSSLAIMHIWVSKGSRFRSMLYPTHSTMVVKWPLAMIHKGRS